VKGFAPLIIVVAIIGVIAFAAMNGLIPASFEGVGFSTLSISNANVETDSNVLSGQQWVVTIVQDSSGGSLSGRFTPEQVKSKTSTGQSPQEAFTFKMDMTKNQVEYPIRAVHGDFDYGKIYQVAFYDMGSYIGASREERLNTCLTRVNGGYDVINLDSPVYSSWICLQKFQVGTFGEADAGTQYFQSTATISKDSGQPYSSQIDNLGATSVNLGSVANLKWQGNLVTGQQVPVPTAQDVCFINYNQTGNWQAISCNNYNTWKSLYTGYAGCLGIKQKFGTGGSECTNDINNALTIMKQQKSFMVSGGSQAQTTGQMGNGVVILPLPKQFSFPVFTLRIKADYIGIVIPAGIPKILSASSEKFSTGGTGLIKTTIRNDGSSLGAFDVSAVCQSPFTSNDRTRINLNPGQTGDVYLKVIGETQNEATNFCRIVVIDVNQPANRDEKTVQVTVGPVAECREGTTDASGTFLRRCVNGAWKIEKECPQGQIADPLTFSCKDNTTPGGGLNFGDLGALFSKFFAGLILGLILLGALAILSMFIPFLAVLAILRNPKVFIVVLLILALALVVFF